MEDFLGLQRDGAREQSTPIDGTHDQNVGPSNSMATIASASMQIENEDMTQQGSNASFQQDHSSVQPLHQNPGNPREQAWSHSSVSCPQSRCPTFSPQYSQLIAELSSELVHKGIGIETILEMLKTILWTDGIQIFMEGAPTDVTDFISLSSHLKEQGMCHETDIQTSGASCSHSCNSVICCPKSTTMQHPLALLLLWNIKAAVPRNHYRDTCWYSLTTIPPL